MALVPRVALQDASKMPGIRIYGAPPRDAGVSNRASASTEPSCSTFSLWFRSIVPELKHDRWFFPAGIDTFDVPSSWHEGEPVQTKVEQMSRLLVCVPGRRGDDYYFAESAAAVEAWLPYVVLDWNEIYVFGDDRLCRDEIVRLQDNPPVPQAPPTAAVVPWAKAYFYSYEGCYWSLYSWQRSLLNAVKADITASWSGARLVDPADLQRRRFHTRGIEIVECTLSETRRIHQG